MKKSIKNEVQNTIVIEKSEFISYLFHVESFEEGKEYINKLHKKYPDATHIVYAIVLENDARSTDDGEPARTSGIPTLEVLRKNDMVNTMCATVRYFGGIKLGEGGLIRAYTRGCAEALQKAEFITLRTVTSFTLEMSYKDSSFFDSRTFNYLTLKKSYTDKVSYDITCLNEDFGAIKAFFGLFKDGYILKNEITEDKFI